MLSDTSMKPEDPFDHDCDWPDDYDPPETWDGGADTDTWHGGEWRDEYGTMHVLKASQGFVRILGRDEIMLGMMCDVEYGYTRQGVEVEIVGVNPTDKRLVTVERTDNKAWEHHKSHTRIVRP